MHAFKYRGNKLCAEGLSVENLARRFGTPLYVYSYKTLSEHCLKLKKAFAGVNPLICFSVKANSNLTLLKSLVSLGCGLDVVSGGELQRALRAGCPIKKIVYASVGKTEAELRRAIQKGILFLNIESLPELAKVNSLAQALNKRARVAIRINPDVTSATHKFITTGKLTNKFGIDLGTAHAILKHRRRFAYVDILGLHIHIGSQITTSTPFIKAITKVAGFIEELKSDGINLEYFNIGGGLGIVYDNEHPQTAAEFARGIMPILKKTRLKIILEPGRFISGSAGILLTRVLYLKHTPRKKFIVVDAAMNDLIRPALYGAFHTILGAKRIKPRMLKRYDVVGPICESGDFFAKDRLLAEVKAGELLAIMGCGAYAFSMSSNYNSRLRPAEVMVSGSKAQLIRKRETFEDLIRNEII